jgi:hypothetical protein
MTDKKITELTGYTTPLDVDPIPIVDIDTMTTKKVTWANIKATLKAYFDTLYVAVTGAQSIAGVKTFTDTPIVTNLRVNGDFQDGTRSLNILALTHSWMPCEEAWTYASPTTITMPGDHTYLYTVGMRVKLDQITTKSFFITAVSYGAPNTTLELNGFGIYMVADAAIINNYYATSAVPPGFDPETIPGYAKARVYLGTDQDDITNITDTKVNLDTESYDIGVNFASGGFVVPVTGYYRVTGQIQYENTDMVADKQYAVKIFLDPLGVGSPAVALAAYSHSSVVGETLTCTISDVMELVCTDIIYLYAYQASGGNTIDIDSGFTYLAIELISAI